MGTELAGRFSVVSVQHVSSLLAALLIVWVAIEAANLTWRLIPLQRQGVTDAIGTRVDPTLNQQRSRQNSAATVVNNHLFGKANTKRQTNVTPKQVKAPVTRLNLKLLGVFASLDKELALAIISSRGTERPYRIGAEVVKGAVIKEIRHDSVLLERGGRLETLKLPRKRAIRDARGTTPRPVEQSPPPVERPNRYRSELNKLRRDIVNNPFDMAKYFVISPVTKGGKLQGYKLRPKGRQELFKGVGLRSNDVVTTINGISISDTAAIGQLMTELSSSETLTLVVENGGVERTVVVNFN